MKASRIASAQASRNEELAKKRAQLKRDFDEVFSSAEGKNVLRAICEMSGFLKSDVVADAAGTIHLKSSLYNMAFRNFYLKLRAYIRPEVLRDVEFQTKNEEGVSAEVDIFS